MRIAKPSERLPVLAQREEGVLLGRDGGEPGCPAGEDVELEPDAAHLARLSTFNGHTGAIAHGFSFLPAEGDELVFGGLDAGFAAAFGIEFPHRVFDVVDVDGVAVPDDFRVGPAAVVNEAEAADAHPEGPGGCVGFHILFFKVRLKA